MLLLEINAEDGGGWPHALTVISGSLAALFTIWKLVGRRLWVSVMQLRELIKSSTLILEGIKSLQADLRPNGGSSIRDAVSRIESTVSVLGERQKAVLVLLLNISGDGLFETDASGQCIDTNREFSEISGLLPHEAIGNGWIVALHADDRERVVDEFRAAIKDRRNYVGRFRFAHASGEVVHVLCRVAVIQSLGKVAGYMGTIHVEKNPNEVKR